MLKWKVISFKPRFLLFHLLKNYQILLEYSVWMLQALFKRENKDTCPLNIKSPWVYILEVFMLVDLRKVN